MGLIPPSYAETFEKHKLFEGTFPLAEVGVKWFTFTYRMAKWYLFFWMCLYPWSSWSPMAIKEPAYVIKGGLDRFYYWATQDSWFPGFVKTLLWAVRENWENRFKLLGWAIALSTMVYISYVIRRQRLYERQVIANDYLSYRAKKKVLRDFNIKGRAKDIDTLLEAEVNQEGKSGRAKLKAREIELREEGQAVRSMRDTMIIYNTRENLAHKVKRTVTIYFYPPKTRVAADKFDKLKEPFLESAEIVLQQYFSEERDRGESVRGNSFSQAVISEVDDPYYYGNELEELEKLKTASKYYHSSPYNPFDYKGRRYLGLTDKSVINNKRHKEATKWANSLTDEISGILRQNGFNTSFKRLAIESRTAEIFYKLPKNFKKSGTTNLKGIEEVIQEQINSSSKPTITLGIDMIRVSISLPNGKDKNGNETDNYVQLLDTEKILRRNFG